MLQTINPVQAAYARKELSQLNLLRAVREARFNGEAQTAIAMNAGVSQAEVSRMLRRIEMVPGMLDSSPRELVLQHVAGEISHTTLLEALENWPYSFSRDAEPGNPLTTRTSGTWDQVTDALHRGLLSEEDYDHLVARVSSSFAR